MLISSGHRWEEIITSQVLVLRSSYKKRPSNLRNVSKNLPNSDDHLLEYTEHTTSPQITEMGFSDALTHRSTVGICGSHRRFTIDFISTFKIHREIILGVPRITVATVECDQAIPRISKHVEVEGISSRARRHSSANSCSRPGSAVSRQLFADTVGAAQTLSLHVVEIA